MFRGLPKWAFVFAALAVCVTATPGQAADDHKPKYHVEYVDANGVERDGKFDLSKPDDAERFYALYRDGKVVKATQEHTPGIGKLFGLVWDLGLWTLIVFGLLLFILSRTAWPAMLEGLKKREQNISDAITSAERARAESERIQQELRAEMAKANDNIRAMMDEARKDATEAKEEMLTAAKKEIGAERDRLRREIETAKDQALLDIWNQSTQLAALISSKTLKREIRADDHKKLFDEAMAEFKSAKASGTAGKA
jgi:F-type H+-transporting ATPase subunit b